MINYRWENQQTKSYYRVFLAKDLFGQWVLTKAWGAINQANGSLTHFPHLSYEEAINEIIDITKKRIKRGYAACAVS